MLLFVCVLVWANAVLAVDASMLAMIGSRADDSQKDSTDNGIGDSKNSRETAVGYGDRNDGPVSVMFYGEAQCPFCRKFVTEVWPVVWNDDELRSRIAFDFVPWGNAYFATEECGKGPEYDSQERRCWHRKCVAPSDSDAGESNVRLRGRIRTDECFSGPVVYQHSTMEGQVDVYESCVRALYDIETAVEFLTCCEGDRMDDDNVDAKALMQACTPTLSIAAGIQECFELRGKQLEIQNAKDTPDHPGVPYVTVNDKALDDPAEVRQAICDELERQGNGVLGQDLPSACLDDSEQGASARSVALE